MDRGGSRADKVPYLGVAGIARRSTSSLGSTLSTAPNFRIPALVLGIAICACVAGLLLLPAHGPRLRLPRTADARCPKLPAVSTISWEYHSGLDFDVCYGHRNNSSVTVVGVYLGHAPSFHPVGTPTAGSSRVDGQQVDWYRRTDNSTNDVDETLLEATIPQRYPKTLVHIWIMPNSPADRAEILTNLRDMKF